MPSIPQPPAAAPTRKTTSLVGRALFSALALFALLEYVGWRDIARHLAELNGWIVALAFGALLLEAFARCLNWWQISLVTNAPIAYRDIVHAYFMGGFVGVFLPSSLSTDASRSAIAAWRSHQPLETQLALNASLNVIGIGTSSAVAIATAIWLQLSGRNLGSAGWLSLMIAVGCWGAILVLRALVVRPAMTFDTDTSQPSLRSRIVRAFSRFRAAFLVLPKGAAALSAIGATALLSYGFRMAGWYALLVAAGASITVTPLLLLAPFVTIGAALPISVAGFGGLQAVYVFALLQWNVSAEQATVVSLVHSALYILLNAVGSITFVAAPRSERLETRRSLSPGRT